jgi:phosphoglycolate phosphatase-like HAD superfamily hydrolase
MAALREGQGLGAASDWQFCLDSDGVETKTDMLLLAVEAAGARRPVMVGDREPDHRAAREAGMPFFWRVNSRCDLATAADGLWHGEPDELLGALGLPRIGIS